MRIDIEKIKNHVDMTFEAFAEKMNISIEELQEYCDGKTQMSGELLSEMCKYTGLQPITGSLYISENDTTFNSPLVVPNDTYESSRQTKTNLIEFIKRGALEFNEEIVLEEIEKIQKHLNTLRKPRITFAGQSDTGKSTLINALLGAEKMPAKWTPTTSIVVHIKHIDDKPKFINEDVWVFGKLLDEYWDDTKLQDEEYCNEFVIAKGEFSLLTEFGTHQNETNNNMLAASAVAFIDSPLLKDCDVLDIPGFGVTSKDDTLHLFNTQRKETDILLYLSRSNGFLPSGDIDYLRECLNSLKPIERNGENELGKLSNLFIIASQAGAVNNGNSSQLNEILDLRCKAFCDGYELAASMSGSKTLLPNRTEQTGYEYSEADFRERFFTYEKDIPRLCEKFSADFTALAEKLPVSLYQEFCNKLEKIIADSSDFVKLQVDGLISMLNEKEKFSELVREIKQKEPARLIERKTRINEILSKIENLSIETSQEIQSKYDQIINVEYLIELIEKKKT